MTEKCLEAWCLWRTTGYASTTASYALKTTESHRLKTSWRSTFGAAAMRSLLKTTAVSLLAWRRRYLPSRLAA